ncbi:MAG: hypothetical protein D6824_05820, partial [Planctomycetota bacterium]
MKDMLSQAQTWLEIELLHIGGAKLTLGGLLGSLLVLIIGYWIARRVRRLVIDHIAPRFNIARHTAFALGSVVFYVIVIVTTMLGLE